MGLRSAGVPAYRYPDSFKPNGPLSLERVTFAVVWKPPEGLLETCPSLRGVHSLGAGALLLHPPGAHHTSRPWYKHVKHAWHGIVLELHQPPVSEFVLLYNTGRGLRVGPRMLAPLPPPTYAVLSCKKSTKCLIQHMLGILFAVTPYAGTLLSISCS